MPYVTNSNYHVDPPNASGYFYESNSSVDISYNIIYTNNHLFLIDPSLNNTGLSIDSSNGRITGTTASNKLSDIEYTVTVSTITPNSIVATEYVRIVVSTEPKFTYLYSSYRFRAGEYSTLLTESPIIQALLWDDYYFTLISPYSDIILSIDPKNGIISGTFFAPMVPITAPFTVKITNKFIEYEQNFYFKIISPHPTLEYKDVGVGVIKNGGIFEFIQGIYGSLERITNNKVEGKISISGCNTSTRLPLGLSFSDITGTIFGIPETISEPHIYIITFTDDFESINSTITLCIKRRYSLTPSLSYDVLITPELQMRKKAEILQHNSNKCNESKKQKLYKLLTRGGNNNRSVECLSRNVLISSSSSDVPGPPINLFYDPTTQLIGNATRLRPNNILPS